MDDGTRISINMGAVCFITATLIGIYGYFELDRASVMITITECRGIYVICRQSPSRAWVTYGFGKYIGILDDESRRCQYRADMIRSVSLLK
jgi:hypothetical protein